MTIHTDNKETLQNALKRIEELEAQIEKMRNCWNCKHDCKLIIAHFGGCDFLGKKEKWEWEMTELSTKDKDEE